MKPSEEFKQALKTGKLSEAFLVAMSNAPELHITTWIATPSDDNVTSPQTGNCLRTHINLVEGKIENEIGENFVGDRNTEIHQFHRQQVSQGHQTIQQNLESLQKMFHLMTAFQNGRSENSSAVAWVDVAADTLTEQERERINGQAATRSLTAGETEQQPESSPAFSAEEDEDLVNELLSLTDLDDVEDDGDDADAEDWGDWLEDETTERLPNGE